MDKGLPVLDALASVFTMLLIDPDNGLFREGEFTCCAQGTDKHPDDDSGNE